MTTTRKPRSLKSPQTCRYCGHVSLDHAREGLPQCVSYSCRDALACGERIRQDKAARGERAADSELAF